MRFSSVTDKFRLHGTKIITLRDGSSKIEGFQNHYQNNNGSMKLYYTFVIGNISI